VVDRWWRLQHGSAAIIEKDDEQLPLALGDNMMRAQRRYRFEKLDGHITLLHALEREPGDRFLPRDLGWTSFASGLTVIDVPGDHATMCLEPNVAALATAIAERIPDHAGVSSDV
jgi:thioesterase domain-containing protein